MPAAAAAHDEMDDDQWNYAGICWSMAVEELFAMDGVHQEQDDNGEQITTPRMPIILFESSNTLILTCISLLKSEGTP